MPKHVVILGGGFGGVYTAHNLLRRVKDATVTLVNDKNYFLFTPMIHEVATGNIHINNVVEPIRGILKGDNFRFCRDTVEWVDLNKKVIKTSMKEIKYDYVVLALGSQTNFYGLPGSEHSLTLKSLQDAFKIRNAMIDRFERANMASGKERKRLLTFVVVGGGPTGVELAAEMADWVNHNFVEQYNDISGDEVSIKLVNTGDKVLKGAHMKIQDKARKVLESKGVELILNSRAKKVGKDFVELDGKKIWTETVVWAAGVRPVDVDVKGVEKVKGAVPVNEFLQVEGFGNAYALGDFASYSGPDGTPPPTAQLAVQQAGAVAKNLCAALTGREQKPFVYQSKGFLASLGFGQAVADIRGFRFSGFFAWWLWRTIYLMKLIGIPNRFRVVVDWTIDLFFKRDSSQI